MAVYQEIKSRLSSNKSLDDSGHQVSDNDKVANADTETFDRNRSIEDDGGIGVGHLREGEERGVPTVEILCAS
jgi:hypothetical protein